MSIYENYFDTSYIDTQKIKKIDIEAILKDENTLICGDFHGIQDFIFEKLATKNASKTLRAKSAFISIFTIYISKLICDRLGISEDNILTQNAGKFEILTSTLDDNQRKILKGIDKKVKSYFIKNFFGLTGISIIDIECSREAFTKKYLELRKEIAQKLEIQKFKKFDLLSLEDDEEKLSYDEGITNECLCKICNLRKIKGKNSDERCELCDNFVKLGKKLVDGTNSINSKELTLNIDDYEVDISLSDELKSYVQTFIKDKKIVVKDFDDLAGFEKKREALATESKKRLEALAIVKADVDNMGKFLKDNKELSSDFKYFDAFSKGLDAFFSQYIPNKLQRKEYQETYTVFSGGDDLFIVGNWEESLKLARRIREEFIKFAKKTELTISFGIVVTKPKTPLSYLAKKSEDKLDKAKEIEQKPCEYNENLKKDAINLFDESVKWDDYLNVYELLNKSFQNLSIENDKTAFFYRLLEFCEMSKKVDEGDILSTIWKSKLSYTITRNLKDYEELLKVLDETIEKYPKETKLFICEKIYSKRGVDAK